MSSDEVANQLSFDQLEDPRWARLNDVEHDSHGEKNTRVSCHLQASQLICNPFSRRDTGFLRFGRKR